MHDPPNTVFHGEDKGIAKGDPQVCLGRMYGERGIGPAEITCLIPCCLDILGQQNGLIIRILLKRLAQRIPFEQLAFIRPDVGQCHGGGEQICCRDGTSG